MGKSVLVSTMGYDKRGGVHECILLVVYMDTFVYLWQKMKARLSSAPASFRKQILYLGHSMGCIVFNIACVVYMCVFVFVVVACTYV